jgi:hypothetical protein
LPMRLVGLPVTEGALEVNQVVRTPPPKVQVMMLSFWLRCRHG